MAEDEGDYDDMRDMGNEAGDLADEFNNEMDEQMDVSTFLD